MRRLLICAALLLPLFLFPLRAEAAELPREILSAADSRLGALAGETDLSTAEGFHQGVKRLLSDAKTALLADVRSAVKTGVLLLLVILLASLTDGLFAGIGREGALNPTALAGVLALTALSIASLRPLLSASGGVLAELDAFSKLLLPSLSAAAAATGAVATAAVQQVVTVLFAGILIGFVSQVLLPLIYCYVALVAASAALPDDRLGLLAESLKKGVAWLLTASVSVFTAYLSFAGKLSASADTLTLRATKAALSGAVPVVGRVISDSAETVLAGASLLKNSIGVFGMLGVISICLLPFLKLLLQYLLYRLTAAVALTMDGGKLSKLVERLGGAFGLLLGMTGACALLLFIAVFAMVAVVTP